jgi:hypothetical protein
MKVSNMTDAEVRKAYVELVDTIYRYEREIDADYCAFWEKLGYDYYTMPQT